jgi:hypothetical protein
MKTEKKNHRFAFSGFVNFLYHTEENIFSVFNFQSIFLYHTEPFLKTEEMFLRFWPKIEYENAIFWFSASTNFGLLFHILILKDSEPCRIPRDHHKNCVFRPGQKPFTPSQRTGSSQLELSRKPTVLPVFNR